MIQAKNIYKQILRHSASFLIAFCLSAPIAKAGPVSYDTIGQTISIELPMDEKTDYEIETKDNNVLLSFSKPTSFQAADIEKKYSHVIENTKISDDKKQITLTTKFPVSSKNFRRKNKLIIDISPQNTLLTANGIDAKNKTIEIEYGNHPQFARFAFKYSGSKKPDLKISREAQKTVVSLGKDIRLLADNLKNYPQAKLIMQARNENGGLDIIFPEKLVRSFEVNRKIVIDIEKAVNDDLEEDHAQKTIPMIVSSEKTVAKNQQMALTQLIPQTNDHSVASLGFPWNIPVNLAVFQRNGYLWIIFDHRQNVDVEELTSLTSKMVDELIQMPHPSATVLRLKLKQDVFPSIRKEGLLWIIDLLKQDTSDSIKDMPLYTQYDSSKRPYLFIPTTAAGNTVTIIDPAIGDIISVSPSSELKSGLKTAYSYPDFELLDSTQGVAMVFKAHDVTMDRSNIGLTIKALNRGLNISADLENLKRHEFIARTKENLPSLIADIPQQILKEKFIKAEELLKQDISSAAEDEKDKARLLLVKYYLAKGLGTNALSVLNKMAENKSQEVNTEYYQGLLGIANFLSGRYEQAIENFSFGRLPELNEAIFWRTLASAAKQPQPEDNVVLLSYISLIKDYPNELKNKIALAGAEIALTAGDDMTTQNFIDVLKTTDSKKDYQDEINYLTARKFLIQGYPRNAIREFRRVAAGKSLKYAAISRKQIANLEIELNAVKPEKAINELERLRFVWSEKEFRKGLLNDLAGLYVRNNDYYNALRSLQKLHKLSTPEEQEIITGKMVSLFEDIYINNRADNLPALKSLALYQDFEWLAPKSKHYNMIIQKLSDRLVAVDLLDRAEQLLTDELKNNILSSEERASVGARLALIYLFKDLNSNALQILDQTENDDLPQTLYLHRKIIRAKALAALGKQEEALELIKYDYSRNALLLKSEIYWNGGIWGHAADNLKYLIEKPVEGKPLSEEQINLILDWATALKKSGKETVIVRLRNKFMPYFKNTKYHSVFNILTNRLEDDKIDIKQIDNVINDVAAYSNFAKIYNDSLRNTKEEDN